MTEIDFGGGPATVALRSVVASSTRSMPAGRPPALAQVRAVAPARPSDQRLEPLRVAERRRPTPATAAGTLDELPARVLLDRLTMPVLAVGFDGVVVYVNPACANLLGHDDPVALKGRPLNELLERRFDDTASECVAMLKSRTAGSVTTWLHAEGFPVSTLVSRPLLRRDDDEVLLVAITDVSESLWRDDSLGEHFG